MNYSADPGMVRADVFKPDGKWYETIALDMGAYYNSGIAPHYAVHQALLDANHYKPEKWIIVVPEPYHVSAYPVLLGPDTQLHTLI